MAATHDCIVTWPNDQPAATVPVGSIIVTITGGPVGNPVIPPVSVVPNSITATVPAVPEEGTNDPLYVATVQAFDTSSPPVALGTAMASDPFSVAAPVVVAGLPGKPTVVVGPANA